MLERSSTFSTRPWKRRSTTRPGDGGLQRSHAAEVEVLDHGIFDCSYFALCELARGRVVRRSQSRALLEQARNAERTR